MDFIQSSLQRFGCTDSLDNGDEDSLLLRCPDLVIKKIMQYLNPHDLKIFRLTSKTTKAWVEDPNVLKRLNVVLNGNEKKMKDILKSKILWNNLSLLVSQDFECPKKLLRFHSSRYLFSKVFRKLAPTLKIIHVDSIISPTNIFGPPDLMQEVEQCKNLMELEYMSIDLLQFRDGCRPEFDGMIAFLKNIHLKHLKIKEIDDYEFDLEGKSTFFNDILFSCKELIALDAPCRVSIPWKKRHKLNERENVILPIVKYLKQQLTDQKRNGLKSIRIGQHSKPITLKSDQCPLVQELIKVCVLNHTTLHYTN